MKRKHVALALSAVMALGLLTGCGEKKEGNLVETEENEIVENLDEVVEGEDVEGIDPDAIIEGDDLADPAIEEDDTDGEEEEFDGHLTKDITEEDAKNIQVTGVSLEDAVEHTEIEDPAHAGDWVKTKRYNAVSREYETVFWRIAEISFDCQEDVDEYNSRDYHFYELEPLESDDLSYVKVTYQVYFPEEFSADTWGISAPTMSFTTINPAGGGIRYKGMSYIGLGTMVNIDNSEEHIQPGGIYTGKCVYVMVNDPSIEYVFDYYYSEGDGLIHSYILNQ